MIEHLLEQLWPVTADPSVTKTGDGSLDLTTEQQNSGTCWLKPVLCVLQVATTYQSAEYNVCTSIPPTIHGLTKSMEVTEEDSPAVCQCKCAISLELRGR